MNTLKITRAEFNKAVKAYAKKTSDSLWEAKNRFEDCIDRVNMDATLIVFTDSFNRLCTKWKLKKSAKELKGLS